MINALPYPALNEATSKQSGTELRLADWGVGFEVKKFRLLLSASIPFV